LQITSSQKTFSIKQSESDIYSPILAIILTNKVKYKNQMHAAEHQGDIRMKVVLEAAMYQKHQKAMEYKATNCTSITNQAHIKCL
jgi:hypothetical protein